METETMIRELRRTAQKHQNDVVPTFGTNITVMCNDILPKIEKLKQYEDSEQQGLLMKFPCKVGDTVYRVDKHDIITIRETGVEHITLRDDDIYIQLIDMTDDCYCELVYISDFGKTVFLTKEEAEQKLSETN